jgi:co-chaperonin GroES (HSP10)|tara:strand:+ start:143 stop:421 length:279 start_codon:yes stop_codon:yes gene_type:complete
MNFEPMNRHLLIEPIEEEQQQENVIVLPEEYRPQKSPYLHAQVVAKADNVDIPVEVGDVIVCERRMLNEIKTNTTTHYLMLQNYVFGRVSEE